MSTIKPLVLFMALALWSAAVGAQVGVTDACQEDIKDLEDKIDNNKDDYTAESRRKAQRQLAAAKTNRLNPAKCRENVLDARRELQEGKRDKKKND